MYKNIRIWEADHKKLKIESAQKDKQLIERFSEIMNGDIRIINGKRYRVVPMDSDFGLGGSNRAVKSAKMARSNRVLKDG
jgi:hypothetical protein